MVSKATASATITRADLRLNILPRRMVRVLRFSSTSAFSTAATTGYCPAPSVFLLTSIWDPYTGIGGVSAYGTSQLATWYSRYLVTHCKVTLSASTIGGTAEVAVCYKIDNPSGYVALTGQSYDRCVMSPMVGVFLVGPSGNDRTNKVVIDVAPWAALGITRQQYVDEYVSYGAVMTANPSSAPTLQVAACSPSNTASEAVTVSVILDYTVELTQPIELAAST